MNAIVTSNSATSPVTTQNTAEQQHRFELSLHGAFDATRVQQLRADLDYLACCQHNPIVLNLAAVNTLDSSGVGAIVYLYKRLAITGRTLEVTGVNGQPLQLMQSLRIDKSLNITTVQA
ncbi:MAG: STAS domain-containing protein [Marinobacterium sp.]|nr:STAS domain-containing protein [Marinobacterium sp.]